VPISFQNVVDVSITSHDPEAAKLIGVRDWAMGAGMPAEHVFGAADSTRASDKKYRRTRWLRFGPAPLHELAILRDGAVRLLAAVSRAIPVPALAPFRTS
jgi:hypothetical protein